MHEFDEKILFRLFICLCLVTLILNMVLYFPALIKLHSTSHTGFLTLKNISTQNEKLTFFVVA